MKPNFKKLVKKRDVKKLIKFLDYQKDEGIRRDSARALGEIGDSRAVDPLIATLKDKDWGMRMVAAMALGKIGDVRALNPLIATLNDKNSSVRKRAVHALGNLKNQLAVYALIAALKDITDVREAAVEALGEVGQPSVNPLIDAIKNDPYVRNAAFQALEGLGWEPEINEVGAHYWIAKRNWDRCVEIGKPAVVPLIALLKDKDRDIRNAATEALVKIGPRAINLLIAVLSDENWSMREEAKDVLVRIGKPAVEPLIAALKDENDDIRSTAAYVLLKIGHSRAVVPLIEVLNDRSLNVRIAAATALGMIRNARAIDPLIAVLSDENYPVRSAAAEALGKLGKPAVEPLIAALNDKKVHVREVAAEALGLIRDPSTIEPLIISLSDEDKDVRESASEGLQALRWKPEKDEVGAQYWIVKRNWDRCVEIGTHAVRPLVAALNNEDVTVRNGAAMTLQQLGWKPGNDELVAQYWIAKRDWDRCFETGAPAVIPLIDVLKDEDWGVRKNAAEVLVRIYAQIKLDGELKKRIIAARESIVQRFHIDRDYFCSDPPHDDYYKNTVDFPL